MRFLRINRKLFKVQKWKIIISLSAILIVFNEYILYELCYWKWMSNNESKLDSKSNMYNILFVADPQLIGMEYEYKIFGPVIRWDADRFLKSGFSRALKYTNPDIIVFLGDIFDEGEIATDYHFGGYIQRFNNIFTDLIKKNTSVMVIPGDNDIGGENLAQRAPNVVTRFIKQFSHSFPYAMSPEDGITFIAADIRSDADFRETANFANHDFSQSKLNILLNHESVGTAKKIFKEKVDFQLIVTGHTHLSRYRYCEYCGFGVSFWSAVSKLESYDHISFQLGKSFFKVVEITVPTCSYRMGVPFPGYGYLKLYGDGHIVYRVLWLPYRYYCLSAYCAFVVVVVVLMCCSRLRCH